MINQISRNYISGLSSGMDTDALIEKIITASSSSKYALQRQRNRISYQQSMLQEINLSLYSLQNKATDLTFSSTFTAKKAESSDPKMLGATVTTAAKTGTYNLKVRQLATSTSVSSSADLAGPIEEGHVLKGKAVGGVETLLSSLGISSADLKLSLQSKNGAVSEMQISPSINSDSDMKSVVSSVNQAIQDNQDFRGKVYLNYDEKSQKLKFTLNNPDDLIKIQDKNTGNSSLMQNMFGGSVTLDRSNIATVSDKTLSAGGDATLEGLGVVLGNNVSFRVTVGSQTANIQLNGIDPSTNLRDLADKLNAKLRDAGLAGDPASQPIEFRFDEGTGTLKLASLNTAQDIQFSLRDGGSGNIISKLFDTDASGTATSVFDGGKVLSQETFKGNVTGGVFTLDGVRIQVDAGKDTLQDVLKRITSMTDIEAYYDSAADKVIFERKDGTDAPIGIGSSADTSNFLHQIAMIASEQIPGTAKFTSSRPISEIKSDVALSNAGFAREITAGTFSINGKTFEIADTSKVSMDSLIKMINDSPEAGVIAQYSPSSGKFVLHSSETGNRSIAIGKADDTSNFLSVMGLADAKQEIGQNAIYSISGLYGGEEQVSQSNSIDGAIEGVTFNLYGVTQGAGETITIKTDTDNAKAAIDEFIKLYNEVSETIYTKLTEERNKELDGLTDEEKSALSKSELETYEKAYKKGLLAGDNSLMAIRNQMRTIMSRIMPDAEAKIRSLEDIGISTGVTGANYKETLVGTLKIVDENKLNDALANHSDEVAALFNSDGSKTGVKGIGTELRDFLREQTKTGGLFTGRIGRADLKTDSSMDRQIALLNKRIAEQEARLYSERNSLIQRFSALEQTLNSYQSQANYISGQLASLMSGK
ncbi:MAG: flagellar filament capping protein FliD [Candidatus Riflebacteria bacterium]|nr:flagellar filament capping protein FliD [Candidatus Riflebacteria bacterium]